ncbi:hypothetical protein D3C83_127870 [compost metagenome]
MTVTNGPIQAQNAPASTQMPAAPNKAPEIRGRSRPVGTTFSRRIRMVRPKIHSRFMMPPTNSRDISTTQQPRQ